MSQRPVTELVSRATARQVVTPTDGKSSSRFERLSIDGQPYFLKRLSPATDWIMRSTGDRLHRPYLIWQAGLMDRLPVSIDHAVVAMELQGQGEQAELSILMRDVGRWLVPEGDGPVEQSRHEAFISHMGQLCATFWGWEVPIADLTTMSDRLLFFGPSNVAREVASAAPPGPMVAAEAGWRALRQRSVLLDQVANAVWSDTSLLTGPLARTPATFLHGDWKMGNLGAHPGGRTILLDWAYPGLGPACWDLCWYLALNRARLPEAKEAVIKRFRKVLEEHGVDTTTWFDVQLDLCLVAIMVTFGWEKALGEEAELRWWEKAVTGALERQGLGLPQAAR